MTFCQVCNHDLPEGFCHACCKDFPPETMSPDPRYCPECYEFLLKEAELITNWKKPAWVPVITPSCKRVEAKSDAEKPPTHGGVPTAKLSKLNEVSNSMDNFRPRGRPKTYRKRELPENLIYQLYNEGLGSQAIAARLKKEKGVEVSYKTIQRMLSGERKSVDVTSSEVYSVTKQTI
ncbi:hypothetical protein ACFLW6_05340 [Chloroflexota bacterium]